MDKAVSADDLASGSKTDKTSTAPAKGNRPYYKEGGKQKPLEGKKTGKPVSKEEMYSYGGPEDYAMRHRRAILGDKDISNYRKYANPKEASMKSIIDSILEKATFFGSRAGQNVVQESEIPPVPANKMRGSEARSIVGHKEYSYNPKGTITAMGPGGKKEIPANKEHEKELKEASMRNTVDSILEKAVYGAGASGGKFQRGSGKDESKPGAVRKPELSEEQKKKLISGAQAKAANQAERTGLHATAAKIRAEKSLDERTTDLVKALNVDYGHRKSGVRRGGSSQDPDAGWDKIKEQRMDRDASKLKESIDDTEKKLGEGDSGPMKKKSQDSDLEKANGKVPSKFFDKPEAERKRIVGERAWKNYDEKNEMIRATHAHEKKDVYGKPTGKNKSLDERTCDLVKDLTKERGKEIHDAVMTARMIKEDLPEASNMKVKPEDLTRVVRTHNNIAAARTQKSICDKWQTDSAFITKGARVMPLGPGGEVSTLSKDEENKPKSFIGSIPGARGERTSTEPSYNEVEAKMNEIQEGKRSKRAAKIKDAFGAE